MIGIGVNDIKGNPLSIGDKVKCHYTVGIILVVEIEIAEDDPLQRPRLMSACANVVSDFTVKQLRIEKVV